MQSTCRFLIEAGRTARSFLKDCRGIAAVEFAFIVPLMLVLFFGAVEFSQGIGANRKVTIMARTLSDLTSQNTTVTAAQLNNLFAAATAIMTPYPVAPVQSTISELYIDPNTQTAKVQWSVGSAARGQGSTVAIPSQLIARDAQNNIVAGQYLIYSEVTYLYVPTVGYVMAPSGVNLRDVAFTRPRQSTCVMYNTSVCTTF
jgi:Flp pilus assembly protein TadG